MREWENRWFTFGGIDSRTFPIYVKAYPSVPTSVLRRDAVELPGRPGELLVSESRWAYKSIDLTVPVILKNCDSHRLKQIASSLQGERSLVFGNDPFVHYIGYLSGITEWKHISKDLISADLKFRCFPFRIDNETTSVSFSTDLTMVLKGTASPYQFTVTIAGAGETSIIIDGKTINLHLDDGGETVVLDFDAGNAFNNLHTEFRNEKVTGEFPEIGTGSVTFELGDDITAVAVTYRAAWL